MQMRKFINIILTLIFSIFIFNHYHANDSISFHSSVLLKNHKGLIPLKNLDTLEIASLNLSSNNLNIFEEACDHYSTVEHFHFNTFSSKRMVRSMIKELKSFNIIIVNTDTIHEIIANMISTISNQNIVILNYVGGRKLMYEDLINKSCQIDSEYQFDNYNKFIDNFLEDYDLWLKLWKQNKKFYNVNSIQVLHRIHQSSAFNAQGNNLKVNSLKQKYI